MTQQYRDHLMPLQDCAVSTWGEDWEDQFFPVGIEQARLGNPEGDDNIYGLPVLVQTINMWYTVPIFEEAGVEPPTTYDELKELADMFNAQGIAPVMIGAGDGWIRRDVYMQLIHNVAPGLIYEAEDGMASFTDEPFVEAMTWWKRLFDDGIFQMGALGMTHYPAAVEQIQAGRAAMFPMGAWWQQQAGNPDPPPLDENLQGYAPFKFPDVTGMGAPEDLLGGIDVMMGVTRGSANPDAACKVITDLDQRRRRASADQHLQRPARLHRLAARVLRLGESGSGLGSLHRRLAGVGAIRPSVEEPGCQAGAGRRAGCRRRGRDDAGRRHAAGARRQYVCRVGEPTPPKLHSVGATRCVALIAVRGLSTVSDGSMYGAIAT